MSDKKIAVTVGLLFLMSTASFMIGDALIQPTLSLITLDSADTTQIIIGVILKLLNSVFVSCIGILLFPILKRYSEIVAISYVATRLTEAVLLAIGAMSLLLLTGSSLANIDSFISLASHWQDLSFSVAMVFLGAGSIALCYVLYETRVIPRVLSAVGLLGYALLMVNAVSQLFGNPMQMGLLLPGAIFELAFPTWLLVKGFNMSPKNYLSFMQQKGI